MLVPALFTGCIKEDMDDCMNVAVCFQYNADGQDNVLQIISMTSTSIPLPPMEVFIAAYLWQGILDEREAFQTNSAPRRKLQSGGGCQCL